MLYRLSLASVFLLCFAPSTQAAMVVTDTEFLDANWSLGLVVTGVGAASGTQFGQEQIAFPGDDGVNLAGNPGAFQYFGQTHGGRQNGTMTARGFHIFEAFTYDPSQGPLQSLNMSFDALTINNADGQSTPSNQLFFGVAVRQNNNPFFAGVDSPTAFEVWTSMSFNDLTVSDFTYSGGLPVAPQLDFSVNGTPIHFGYYAFHSANFTTNGRGGVDNYRLEINPQQNVIPEPSSFVLGATFLIGLAIRRRLI